MSPAWRVPVPVRLKSSKRCQSARRSPAGGQRDAGADDRVDPRRDPLAARALRAAGVRVRSGLGAAESLDLNRQWFEAVTAKRPFVTLHIAQTLDSRIAAEDGTSQWISCPESLADNHGLRRRIDAIEDDGVTESRWTERHIGHPVIKAFNGTYAQDILDKPLPAGDPERMALPVAGDDEAAKKVVRDLIDELGFDTVDAGGIDESWRQQPDTPVYGLRAGVAAVTDAIAAASPERPATFRA